VADAYVCDAFAAAHRNSPTLSGFGAALPCIAGVLMQRELEVLGSVIDAPLALERFGTLRPGLWSAILWSHRAPVPSGGEIPNRGRTREAAVVHGPWTPCDEGHRTDQPPGSTVVTAAYNLWESVRIRPGRRRSNRPRKLSGRRTTGIGDSGE